MNLKIERLYISADPTDKCDRGCVHCGFDSRPNVGNELDEAVFARWLKRLGTLRTPIVLSLSGGGETLLHSRLPRIMAGIHALKNLEYVSLVSSGSRISAEAENERWDEILSLPKQERTDYCLSFNLYGKHFPERLLNTLPRILGSPSVKRAAIKLNATPRNFLSTNRSLVHTLCQIEVQTGGRLTFYDGLVDEEGAIRDYQHIFTGKKVFDMRFYARLLWSAHLLDTRLVVETKDGFKELMITTTTTAWQGRAKRLIPRCGRVMGCDFMFQTHPTEGRGGLSIHLGADGYYYPNCCCPRQADLRIGRMDELPVLEAFARNVRFYSFGHKMILSRPEPISDFCDLCRRSFVKLGAINGW